MSILGMDIGWGELLIILVVALLVVGPEKLPEYARKTARFVRKFQRITTNLTGEISRAINLDEGQGGKASDFTRELGAIKKSLENDVAELKSSFDVQAKAISRTVASSTRGAATELEKNAREISDTLNAETGQFKAAVNAQAVAVSETIAQGTQDIADSSSPVAEQVPAENDIALDPDANPNMPLETEPSSVDEIASSSTTESDAEMSQVP